MSESNSETQGDAGGAATTVSAVVDVIPDGYASIAAKNVFGLATKRSRKPKKRQPPLSDITKTATKTKDSLSQQVRRRKSIKSASSSAAKYSATATPDDLPTSPKQRIRAINSKAVLKYRAGRNEKLRLMEEGIRNQRRINRELKKTTAGDSGGGGRNSDANNYADSSEDDFDYDPNPPPSPPEAAAAFAAGASAKERNAIAAKKMRKRNNRMWTNMEARLAHLKEEGDKLAAGRASSCHTRERTNKVKFNNDPAVSRV